MNTTSIIIRTKADLVKALTLCKEGWKFDRALGDCDEGGEFLIYFYYDEKPDCAYCEAHKLV